MDTIRNEILEISVDRHGAELMSFKTINGNKEFLWQGDSNYWGSRSLILFPIIGGLPDGKYELAGNSYNMKSHGFARNSDFELVEKTSEKLLYRLAYSQETLSQYPFEFEFFVSYILAGNTLRHGFIVNNLDDKRMLFSVGAHPGFNCPLYADEKIEDYSILFEKPETLKRRIKTGPLLTGEKEDFLQGQREKKLSHSLFYNGAVILDHVQSNWLEIRNSKNSHTIKMSFDNFPYLGIWSSMNDGPFVCIEPWYGVDSTAGDSYDLEKKEGLQTLTPGGKFSCEYSIELN